MEGRTVLLALDALKAARDGLIFCPTISDNRKGGTYRRLYPVVHFGVDPVFRIGLSVYLMFATLAGPWLCCCQLSRLSAQLTALLRIDKAKSAETIHCCCQQRVPMKDSQPSKHPKAPSCPCQNNRENSPALVSLESQATRQLDRELNAQTVDLLGCDCLSGIIMPSLAATLTSSALSAPDRTGRDILSSLHILRC
jgi:hypothetical protein